jgi:hypothetical protein
MKKFGFLHYPVINSVKPKPTKQLKILLNNLRYYKFIEENAKKDYPLKK